MKLHRKLTVAMITVSIVYASLKLAESNYLSPIYTIRSELNIAATPTAVWEVLTDFKRYPLWNPYLTKVEGDFEVGQVLSATLIDRNFPKPLTVKARLTEIQNGESFYWTGILPIPGIMHTRHFFVVTPLADGSSQFAQYEEFKGLLPLLMPNTDQSIENTQAAFQAMNEAIKLKLEQ